MAKVNWPKDWPVNKSLIEQAVRQAVEIKIGRKVFFSYLLQLTTDDLILLAMTMGYKPPQTHLDHLDRQVQQVEERRLRYAEPSNKTEG